MGDALTESARQTIRDEIRSHGHEFSTAESTAVEALRDAVTGESSKTRVVGLGEASHGTREIFDAKAELIESLVTNEGLRLVCLEASFAATLAINDYVLGEPGDGAVPLPNEYVHHPFNVERVRELVEWIAAFNRGRPPTERIRVHGVDVQYSTPVVRVLRELLSEDDAAPPGSVTVALDRLADSTVEDADEESIEEHLEARDRVASEVRSLVDPTEPGEELVGEAGDAALIRRLVWCLERGSEQFAAERADGDADSPLAVRDRAMTDQLLWACEYEDVDAAVLWGHNAHVGRDGLLPPGAPTADRLPSVGANLAADPDVDYYALGMHVGGGEVDAMYLPEMERRAYEMESPPDGSLPAVLNGVAGGGVFVEPAELPTDSEAYAFLNGEQETTQVTGAYAETPVETITETPAAQYDGIAHFTETTPTRPLEGGS